MERTSLTVEAIRQRIKRGKLDAVKGNDGLLRVRLTTADLEGIRDRPTTSHPSPTATGQPVNDDRLIKALQDAAEARGEAVALRERAEMAEARAAALAERVEAERRLADARAQELVEVRERAARAEGESLTLREQITVERAAVREQVTAERQRAEASARDLEVARAELADWTAGGPLARAWRAFMNRRGRT